MRKLTKLIVIAAAIVVAVAGLEVARAATYTNAAGKVYTVSLASELTASEAAQNATRYAQRVGEQGLLVAVYDLATDGATGAISLRGCTVPKGAILLEDSFIEVVTGMLPADGTMTNAITVGGVTVLSASTNALVATNAIVAAVSSAAATTSAEAPVLTITGTATAGKFIVYMPYIQGTVWE